LPRLENKKRMIQDAVFIHPDPGHVEADKPRKKWSKNKKQRQDLDKTE
jgi:hypothetical protein